MLKFILKINPKCKNIVRLEIVVNNIPLIEINRWLCEYSIIRDDVVPVIEPPRSPGYESE